jgi:protein SCO1/2
MLSHTFAKVQATLRQSDDNAHLISISIDPENDTPAKLTELAGKFGAKAGWDHYTSSLETSISIQKAFAVYRGDKMNHSSVVLMRAAPNKPWLRLEGFVSPDTIIREYHSIKPQK